MTEPLYDPKKFERKVSYHVSGAKPHLIPQISPHVALDHTMKNNKTVVCSIFLTKRREICHHQFSPTPQTEKSNLIGDKNGCIQTTFL